MTFSRPGAVDLSSLAGAPTASPGRPGAGAAGPAGAYTVAVTEQSFEADVVQASMRHVVVLSLWSSRAPESERLNATLSALADSYAGRLLVATVDVDAAPQIAQALRAQGVPLVVGLVQGQPVPLFQGTVDEAEARAYLDKLLELATQNGLTGTVEPRGAAPEPEDEADDPRFAVGDAAYAEGDLATAVAEYERLAASSPGDETVTVRLAGARLMQRVQGADLQVARQAAADAPDDVDAQLLVADLDVAGGHVEDAFLRLIDLVRGLSGDERERVRVRLIDLFTVVGNDDPRVGPARRSLASALF